MTIKGPLRLTDEVPCTADGRTALPFSVRVVGTGALTWKDRLRLLWCGEVSAEFKLSGSLQAGGGTAAVWTESIRLTRVWSHDPRTPVEEFEFDPPAWSGGASVEGATQYNVDMGEDWLRSQGHDDHE